MIEHPLDHITEVHLLEMVAQRAEEGKTLDFKREVSQDTTKLAADFCAMANSFGGDIVFGIEEEKVEGRQTGRASKIVPLNIDQKDATMLYIEGTFRDKIQPPLPVSGRQVHAVPVAGGYVLIVRLTQSLNAPHRVRPKLGAGDFYARNSRGNEPMDLEEVRNAFLFADSLADRATAFRDRRLAALLADMGAMPLENIPFMITHVVPLQALTRRHTFPIADLLAMSPRLQLASPSGQGLRQADPNYEGVICRAKHNAAGQVKAYAQLFRDGCMEIVGGKPAKRTNNPDSPLMVIDPQDAERTFLRNDFTAICQTLDALRVVPPAMIFVSWIGINGYAVRLQDHHGDAATVPLPDRLSTLIGPPAFLDGFEPFVGVHHTQRRVHLMKPALDVIWNAAGMPGTQTPFPIESLHY